jgi:copper type II ascorbate-dependent monooxygenase-like protein
MLSTSRLDTLARIREVRMRSVAFVLLAPLLACSASMQSGDPPTPDGPAGDDGGVSMMPPRGFQVTSPPIDIAPGEDSTYCYYFRTSNIDELSIQRWASHMGAGIHDIVLYLTPTPQQPSGMMPTDCGIVKTGSGTVWSYSAQTADAEASLPSDDGDGKPVGQLVKASQPGFLQIHVLNTTASTLHAGVTLDAYAYPADVQVTYAAPFVALSMGNMRVMVSPGSATSPAMGVVNGNCAIPSGEPLRFFGITTYTHKQGVHTFVKDGATTVFDSSNWEHPGTTRWPAPPFYTFHGNALTYQCDYRNRNSYTIYTGDSTTAEEMCMAIGFFFPAAGGSGHFCVDSAMLY